MALGLTLMTPAQLEHWILSVVDRAKSGHAVEDSRVELKARWPEAVKAARRIAGHANASGGAAILWVIGVDEDTKAVTAAEPQDLADWWPQVRACFDGLAPGLVNLAVPTGDGTVVGLLFDTTRAPFVVRNPAHGTPGGGPVEWEVPWREGTAVRSARREDLVRLLVPLQQLPEVELLTCRLVVNVQTRGSAPTQTQSLTWDLRMELYITPVSDAAVVIPFHRSTLTLAVPGFLEERTMQARFEPRHALRYDALFQRGGREVQSLTVDSTVDEAIITGPGLVKVSEWFETAAIQTAPPDRALVRLVALPVHTLAPITVDAQLAKVPTGGMIWELVRPAAPPPPPQRTPFVGVEVGKRFFDWDGPLNALDSRDGIGEPSGLIEALKAAGAEPSFGFAKGLSQYLARGLRPVYETDRQAWKKPILYSQDGDQILFVRPPGEPDVPAS